MQVLVGNLNHDCWESKNIVDTTTEQYNSIKNFVSQWLEVQKFYLDTTEQYNSIKNFVSQ